MEKIITRFKHPRVLVLAFVALIALAGSTFTLAADATNSATLPFVSPMFGDNMVLQRGKLVKFWGWSKPGELVRVEMAGLKTTAKTGANGRWQAEIHAPAPGGPYTVKIIGPEQTVVLHEVLVGDVWLCGGQSNMQLGLGRARNGAEEIKAANHPEIRFFIVQNMLPMPPPRSRKAHGKFARRKPPAKVRMAGFRRLPISSDENCRTNFMCRSV